MNPGQLTTAGHANTASEISQPGDTVLAEGDRRLAAARETFPDWGISPVIGGYLAVPKGTPLIRSATVDGIVAQLRRISEVQASELETSLELIIYLLQHRTGLDESLMHSLDMARVIILRRLEDQQR
jgi:hypothetical protein